MMRSTPIIVPALALLACQSVGQTTTNAPPASNSPSLASEDETEKAWSFSDISREASCLLGTPAAFAAAFGLVLLWLVSGRLFGTATNNS